MHERSIPYRRVWAGVVVFAAGVLLAAFNVERVSGRAEVWPVVFYGLGAVLVLAGMSLMLTAALGIRRR